MTPPTHESPRLTPDEIDDLARRAGAGERDALEDLLAAVQPRVLTICHGVLPFSGDAEDACQDVLVTIATKVHQFTGQSRFTTWLHVVAVNTARSTYRRLKAQATPTDAAVLADSLARPDPRTTSVIAGTRLDLLDAVETVERTHPLLVEPLMLRDVYGLPYDEIARLLDCPVGTVKSRVHDARKMVRPLLQQES
ncbi:MAG: RNA polymerase sigma factor [Nocardioides sp.]